MKQSKCESCGNIQDYKLLNCQECGEEMPDETISATKKESSKSSKTCESIVIDEISEMDTKEVMRLMEDRLKQNHSQNAIFFFFVFGIILFLVYSLPIVHLATLGFFLVGMFLVATLSIPSYYVKAWISKKILLGEGLVLQYFYWIFEIGYDFLVTYLLFRIFLFMVN